ncbi:hypothetical protein GSbR_27320 [Geobacter sp. SVR]|nr:hypothetical protein GSbR_27320 [Geobacter sp. SVR]
MHSILITFHSFLHEEVEAEAIPVLEEDVLSGVATQNHVVTGSGIMNSGFSSHGEKVPSKSHSANPTIDMCNA